MRKNNIRKTSNSLPFFPSSSLTVEITGGGLEEDSGIKGG